MGGVGRGLHRQLRDALQHVVCVHHTDICLKAAAECQDSVAPLLLLLLLAAGAATAVPEGGELAGASSSSCPAPPGLVFSRIGATQQDLQDMMEMANARQVRGTSFVCVCGGGMTGNVVGSQVLGCMQVGLECTGAEEGNHAFAVAGKFGTCVFVCALNYCCCHTHPPPPRHTHHTPRRRALLPRRLTPLGRLMTKVGPGSNSNLTTSTCRMCVLCFFLGGRGGVGQRRCGWGGGGG